VDYTIPVRGGGVFDVEVCAVNKEELLRKCIEVATKYGDEDTVNKNVYRWVKWVEDKQWGVFIFDHSFCKSFAKYIIKSKQIRKLQFLSGTVYYDDETLLVLAERQFKIELVLAPDRLEYLKQFLGEKV
jgi:hypothetical protein